MPNNSVPLELIGRMKLRWESGDRTEDIGRELRVHPSTVRQYAKKNSWIRGSKKHEVISEIERTEKEVMIANKVERSVQETENFLQDSERMRAMVLNFQTRLLRNRDKETNEILLDKSEAELVFQYLKCCKITMETLSLSYLGKRKALGMDEALREDATVLPWED